MKQPPTISVITLDGGSVPDRRLVGGKAWSIASMRALGLNVPPAFVISTDACREYFSQGGIADHMEQDIESGIAWLEAQTGRRFGGGPRPLLVSVRSGAAISMPGMMDTVLNLGITDETEALLADEWGDAAFARDVHRRFLDLYAKIVLKTDAPVFEAAASPAAWRSAIAGAAGGGGAAHGGVGSSHPARAGVGVVVDAPRPAPLLPERRACGVCRG